MICYEKDGVQMIVNESMARVMESCGYKRAVEKAAPSSVQIPTSEPLQAIKTNPSDTDTSEPKTEQKQYQRSEILRMSTADLKDVAVSIGIEVTEGSTGKMLKEQIVEKLGL
jgi:hypothetical protein